MAQGYRTFAGPLSCTATVQWYRDQGYRITRDTDLDNDIVESKPQDSKWSLSLDHIDAFGDCQLHNLVDGVPHVTWVPEALITGMEFYGPLDTEVPLPPEFVELAQ